MSRRNAVGLPRELCNSDSISTHESTFLTSDGKEARPSSAGPKKLNRASIHSFRSDQIFREEAIEAAKLSRKKFSLEAKLEAAQFRRDRLNNLKGSRANANNNAAFLTSKKALQKRWAEDTLREKKSFIARRSNEEQVMLRKIYKGLLKRWQDIKNDDEQEFRNKVRQIRDEAKNHIKSLQAVFEDRLQILKEQRINSYNNHDKFTRAFRQMKSSIERSTTQKQNKLLNNRKNLTLQHRQKQLNNRVDAHRVLMSVLSGEDWSERLRVPE